MSNAWMIYGANGCMGRLIANEAVSRGYEPILAGRNSFEIMTLADTLDVKYQIFDVNHQKVIKDNLSGQHVLLNCAGPFSETAESLQKACLETGTHYVDIASEYTVLESSYQLHKQARKQGVVVISGVGFAVMVPDALALMVKQELPAATHLALAFAFDDIKYRAISSGVLKTWLNLLIDGNTVRDHGELTSRPWSGKYVNFSDTSRYCIKAPSGSLVTAFYLTDINNICVYVAAEASLKRWFPLIVWSFKILNIKMIKALIFRSIDKKVSCPDVSYKQSAKIQLTAKAWMESDDGDILESVEKHQGCIDRHYYTMMSSLMVVEQLLAHKIMPGAYAPCQVIDVDRVLELADCDTISLNKRSDLLQVDEDMFDSD